MNHSVLRRLAGVVLGLAGLGLLPFACVVDNGATGNGASASKVGNPCAPIDESNYRFSGYRMTEDVIEIGAPECGGGVCLMNHFQGRVSCPLGQEAPVDAQGLPGCTPKRDGQGAYTAGQGSCKDGDQCVQAGSRSPKCDLSKGQEAADKECQSKGAGAQCGASGVCECKTDADCLFVTEAIVSCDTQQHQCITYACHKPGDCQQAGASDAANAGKACCVPGTDTPVVESVCGQCEGQDGHATRDADNAVYCTCRCGVAEGEPDEPDYDFCACPDGFECSEVRKNYGIGDASISGKYCVKQGTAYDPNKDQCGLVDGHWASGANSQISCRGVASGNCMQSGGSCD